MSSQPVSGYQWNVTVGTGVGTTVLADRACVLHRLVIPGTYVGTIKFDDAASAAGTTATSQFLSLGLPATSVFQSLALDVSCRKGLVVQSTGTPTMTVLWE